MVAGVALPVPELPALLPEVSGACPWKVGPSPETDPLLVVPLVESSVVDPAGPATRMATVIVTAAPMLATLATTRLRRKRRWRSRDRARRARAPERRFS